MKKVIHREQCPICNKIKEVGYETMSECVGCKRLICISCSVPEAEALEYMKKTGKGKIVEDDPDPDMNGAYGEVCPDCFFAALGRRPEKPQWNQNSLSSGEIVGCGVASGSSVS